MIERAVLVGSNVGFLLAAAAHRGPPAIVYFLMAIVSILYHVYQPYCDERAHNDRSILRWLDHLLGWTTFAMNTALLYQQWQRRPAVAAVSTTLAAASGVLYLCSDYPSSHSLWHLTAGVGSALLAL